MKTPVILLLTLIVLSAGAFVVSCSSSGSGGGNGDGTADGGSLSVSVDMNIPEPQLQQLMQAMVFAVFPTGADALEDTPLGVGAGMMNEGKASGTAYAMPSLETVWIGTNGSTYDVYIWIEEFNEEDFFPDPGELVVGENGLPVPQVFVMSGNMAMAFDAGDFVVYSPPQLLSR